MLPITASDTGIHMGLVAERAAAKYPDTPITLDHEMPLLPGAGPELTFAAFADHIDDVAARLWAAGVRTGEHVALYKTAGFDINILSCAVSRIGAVPVQLSPGLDGASVLALLDRLGQPYLVTDLAKLDAELSDPTLPNLAKEIFVVAGAREGTVSLADLAGAPRREPVELGLDEPALITHTSGTTGLPKLLVHTPRTLHGRYRPQAKLFDLVREHETVALHVSYVHSRMPLALAVLLPRGVPFLVMDDADPEKVAELFARTRPAFVESAPNSFMEWEELADDPRRPFANVKYFSSTFDAIHPGTMHRLLHASDRHHPVFYQIYGQSETGPLVGRSFTRQTALGADGRCQGYAFPGDTKFRLVGRDGKAPSKEHPGYIEVQAAGRVLTYFGEGERYAKQVDGDGWWRGMDVGYRTEEGCLHLLDREVDVVPTIHSTLEVEDAVLGRLPELAELVLLRGPSDEPLPVVCTRGDVPLDPERWREAVTDFPTLAPPVQMRLEELPRTATMKVQRLELTRRLREGLGGGA
ncbi:class I adenylate-forming enzyme family protein [Streptomyces albireticuli]|uniref:Long-chain acyl-CoA synthetase n=1 Tax=Streptomyces albireticuli TaxID=1940 RepID=A0A2A2D6S2_9ACTN|nr:class I adenylate-forming enzyme family protein [Streptomyces albireticuli]MCD9143588.1 acyl--CoA ligase [Streptomyces albireticuli]MCD9161981.1 acyl--CoA ligase [Streptomyces albireticuli]MCD9191705.1 acyl--CoA ligase [Streptomyces albireticuli]PAU47215.1 long-chain acyl-CoA synthetase [Streptomyces albireticuli]